MYHSFQSSSHIVFTTLLFSHHEHCNVRCIAQHVVWIHPSRVKIHFLCACSARDKRCLSTLS